MIVLALIMLAAATAASSPAPSPPPNGATLNTGVYTVEGQNMTWNQKSGEFTFPNTIHFTQPGTDVTGDKAQGNSIQRKVTIDGHVVMHNSKPVSSLGVTAKTASNEPQTLTTDQLQVDGPAKVYVANGNVKFVQGSKTVTADHGKLDQIKHLLELNGHVRIDDSAAGNSMAAENVTYDTVNETVTATGSPFQIRSRAQEEPAARASGSPKPPPKQKR